MITYMAKAPSDITAWLPGTEYVPPICTFIHAHIFSSAVWFKVAEAGKDASGLWAATDILTENNSIYTFTVPASLAAGQYIVRHEM